MELGTFSISLAVKDIAVSRAFYWALGYLSLIDPDGNPVLIDQHV